MMLVHQLFDPQMREGALCPQLRDPVLAWTVRSHDGTAAGIISDSPLPRATAA